jgi:HAD superfamily hydrolase (TIGR01509 family)
LNEVSPIPPQLVIFDCDGVLVDSEPISVDVLVKVITANGGAMSEAAVYERFLGMSMPSVMAILHDDYGFAMTEQHLSDLRVELRKRYALELKPIPGVAEAMRRLALKRCVASSGTPERIRLSLRTTGLLELLEPNIYSASMVERGKPAPDLFLYAARMMGVPPAACIVVEDSPAGVSAAKAAGMRVFAFAGGSHAEKAGLTASLAALAPNAVFSDMGLLPDLVRYAGLQAKAG